MYKILIAENIPSLNKGELALLKGMIECFKKLGDYEVSILSALPAVDGPRYNSNIKIVEADFLYTFGDIFYYQKYSEFLTATLFVLKHFIFLFLYKLINVKVLTIMKSSIWKAYLDSDVIMVGHDGTFGIGTRLIPEKDLITFFSYSFLPFIGKILKKPLVIYGGSIAPYKESNILIRAWMSFLLSRIDLITLREDNSYNNLNDICPKNNAVVTADLAFLLNPSSDKNVEKIQKIEGINKNHQQIVGVTVSRKIASKAFPNLKPEESYENHVKIISEVFDDFISETEAHVVFIPHSIGFGNFYDDRIMAKKIYNLSTKKECISLITTEYSPEDLKGIISTFDFFIGQRLHSVVGALSMKVPSLFLTHSKDPRLGIIDDLCKENFIFFIENKDKYEILSRLFEIWDSKNQIQKELNISIEIKKEKSMMNADLLKKLLTR